MEEHLKPYLAADAVIDWRHPEVHARATQLAEGLSDPLAIAARCFEFVRDEIRHSIDYKLKPVTCAASEVLMQRSGYCYAKSHLLAALLRANDIPTGFCYQRLSIHDDGAPYSLHGLNAVHLPKYGWYRIDARGNKEGVDARFTPPVERLAFHPQLEHEADLPEIWPAPLTLVVDKLRAHEDAQVLLHDLPDILLAG